MKYCSVIIICIVFNLASLAFAWPGKVVRVVDGDTIVVLNGQNKQVKIRLYGIDTPEKKQAFGKAAKRFTARLVGNKQVEVRPVTQDRYGRTVGIVYIGDKCLNRELVANGYAWVYRRYCSPDDFVNDGFRQKVRPENPNWAFGVIPTPLRLGNGERISVNHQLIELTTLPKLLPIILPADKSVIVAR